MADASRLRKTLHRYPELSGQERQTAGWIKAFVEKYNPDGIIEQLGGHGLAAIFESGTDGPTVLLRAELDALPIQESNTFEYRSQHEGIAHKCGHDGHASIIAAMAMVLSRQKPSKGRVVLLFQGEEETGKGAEKIIKDPKFQEIKPDFVFALHNLPGYKKHLIIARNGTFASASRGVIIELNGSSSHAAHPELGNSPGPLLPDLINGMLDIPRQKSDFDDFTLLTIIHIKLGEVAFGTNPGKCVVMATLRSHSDGDMTILTHKLEQLVENIAKPAKIDTDISYTEVFPATKNNSLANKMVMHAAQGLGLDIKTVEEPFRWSEDFGHFTSTFPGAFFGLGAGRNHPGLHHNMFDFPDEIIKTGIGMFIQIINPLVELTE